MNESRTHVLKERNIRWYFGTQLISLTGTMLQTSVLSLLIIRLVGIKNAPPLVGTLWALGVLPGCFLALFAGLLVDKWDKCRMLQITAVLGTLQALTFAYLSYSDLDHIKIWQINGLALFMGLVNTVDGIGRNAIIKDAVIDLRNMRSASRYFASLYTFGQVLGSGVAGYLILSIGYTPTFVINALSFVVLVFGLSKMDFSHTKKSAPTGKGVSESIVIGWKHIRSSMILSTCVVMTGIITVFGFAYNAILPIMAETMFHGGPREYSNLAMASGFGALIGGLLSGRYAEEHPRKFIVGGCLSTGIGLILIPLSNNIHVAEILMLFCGLGFMTSFSTVRAEIQHRADHKLIGIVLGFTFMFFYGGMVAGFSGAGYVAKHIGCPRVLVACGAVLITTAFLAPFLPGIKRISEPLPSA